MTKLQPISITDLATVVGGIDAGYNTGITGGIPNINNHVPPPVRRPPPGSAAVVIIR